MNGRRGLITAITLLVAGGALLLVAGGRVWSTTTTRAAGFPEVVATATGATEAPLVIGTGVVALAAAAALAAVRGWGRVLLGALLAVAGAATCVQVLGARTPSATGEGPSGEILVDGSPWWAVAAAAALVVAVAGGLIAARGRRWPEMGERYDRAPAAERPAEPGDVWAALDRGEDPTT